MSFIIPTLFDGTPEYTQITALEGVKYQFIFSYNSKDEHWYLNLRTAAGEEITGCEGMKLVQGGWPIRRVYDQNRPPGELLVLSETQEEPGLYDLGNGTDLVYLTSDEIEELL